MFVMTAYSESRNSSRQEKGDQVARVKVATAGIAVATPIGGLAQWLAAFVA